MSLWRHLVHCILLVWYNLQSHVMYYVFARNVLVGVMPIVFCILFKSSSKKIGAMV